MVALEIMGFDGAGLSVGQTLSCVALYFIWHLAVAAAVEILNMALTIQSFVSSNVTRMCKWFRILVAKRWRATRK